MGRFLLRWVILAVSLLLAAMVGSNLGLPITAPVDGVDDFLRLMLGVAVLSLLNATLGRLLKLATAPLNCLTLGLVALLINALIFWWSGSLGLGFQVGSFAAALFGSIAMALIGGILSLFIPDEKDRDDDR